jgi:1-acyl-sn-glycerol-3-phosphate acyltransferase
MIIFIVLRMCWHLFAGMATCAFAFPLLDKPARQKCIRRWSISLVHICGLNIRIRNPDGSVHSAEGLQPPALIVSNHVSWLDIFVINALEPCRFVAKSDIRNWPLIGWLCAATGTIFIARGKPRDVRKVYHDLVASIREGDRIAFFPEGTTAAQGSLLPFHSNLFEAAIDAGVPVQPYAMRYLDAAGELHSAADFIGEMTIVESILAILKARDITAELTVLAVATHDAIAAVLIPDFTPTSNAAKISRALATAGNPLESSNDPQGIMP